MPLVGLNHTRFFPFQTINILTVSMQCIIFLSHDWEVPVFFKRVSDEAPRDPVISFFQVQFNEHETIAFLLSMHRLENFLVKDDIVGDLAARYKATLVRDSQMRHQLFHSVRESFGDDFVPHVAQAYWPDLGENFRVVHLRD